MICLYEQKVDNHPFICIMKTVWNENKYKTNAQYSPYKEFHKGVYFLFVLFLLLFFREMHNLLLSFSRWWNANTLTDNPINLNIYHERRPIILK